MTPLTPPPARRKVWRLQRNLVLLQPILAPGQTLSGLFLTNVHDKPAIHFRVIGIGPGALLPERRQFRTIGGEIVWRDGRKRWVQPESMPGEIVLSKHWTTGGDGCYPAPVHLNREDGKGLVIVDCRYLLAKVEMPLIDANDF